MNPSFTKLSQAEWDRLMLRDIPPSKVVEHFYAELPIRTFKDVLRSVYPNDDIKARLSEGLQRFRASVAAIAWQWPKDKKQPAPDSVRRMIGNWLNGVSEPRERSDSIGICFALGLDANTSDMFLRQTSEYGFHLREPHEAALFYCLKSGKDIDATAAFLSGLDLSLGQDAAADNILTDIVESEFHKVHTDEDFIAFLDQNRNRFGKMHQYAYKYFDQYYRALASPNEESKLSIEHVVARYLRLSVPVGTNLEGYDALQRMIRDAWAGETSMKSILGRTADVTRKSLLLLYVATSGMGQEIYSSQREREASNAGFDWDFADDMTPEEALTNHAVAIDLMLNDCGFAALDPRNPFDWLILYSLRIDEANDEMMSRRLEKVLKRLFAGDADGNDLHGTR